MTLKLWRALNDPPATHPIFVRNVLLPPSNKRYSLTSAGVIIGFIVAMSEFMPTILILMMPIILAGGGLIYGLDCAVRISQIIAQERKNNTFELLALCPAGVLAVSWVICTSSLYQQQHFSRMREIVRTATRIALVGIGVMLGLFIAVSFTIILSSSRLTLPIILPLVNALAVVVLIYSEYVQSTVIGCLVGLVIPTFSNGTTDSVLYAPAVFLFIKVVSYAFGLLIGFSLLDQIYQQFGLQGGLPDVVLTLARAAIFVLIQEGIIRLMWQILIRRTNTPAKEAKLALYSQGWHTI
jgi:hypothetical protein